jgi:septum formation protein
MFSNIPPLILASKSPRRADLLRQMGVEFAVVEPGVAEARSEHWTPFELSQLNAYRKARTVAKKHPDALVLGADTIVALGTEIFGKPADRAEAFRTLTRLQARMHEVVTGICLIHLRTHREKLFAVTTRVTFKPLNPDEIRRYLNTINPLDKAGAYAIQEDGDQIVESISGSFTNVVGLPVDRLGEELANWNMMAVS